MGSCENYRFMITEYVDGSLPYAAVGALEEHIRECAECRRAVEETRAVIDIVGSIDMPAASAEFENSLADRIFDSLKEKNMEPVESGRVYEFSSRTTGWKAIAALAAMLILAVGFIATRHTRQQSGPALSESPKNAQTEDVKLEALTNDELSLALELALAQIEADPSQFENIELEIAWKDIVPGETDMTSEDYSWLDETISRTAATDDSIFILLESVTEDEAENILDSMDDMEKELRTSAPRIVS